MPSAENKRVAKNAVALTLRMVLVTIVGLYTSRVVLSVLGVEDYGIYGVVGGVVGMASFLNLSMSVSTSRFITFELGRGNNEKLKKIFSTALIIHFIIAIVVAILAETVGLWFLNNKMNFPPDRMFAVNVLYQFTIVSMIVGFTQVPYSATIIAHEKMNVYAYFEIINVVLKLVIVYLLILSEDNRLIHYGALVFAVSVIMAILYRWYCFRNFDEARISTQFNQQVAKEMISFCGNSFFGYACRVVKSSGQPIILNLFWGVIANAAASIALTVSGAIVGMTTSITQAFRPQIIKLYAVGNIDQMSVLMRRSVQFTLFAYALLAVPFLIETPRIITLWLGQTPKYSVDFLRAIIIYSIIDISFNPGNAAIQATGNIRRFSLIYGTAFLCCPILSYLFFRFLKVPAVTTYFVDIVLMTVVLIVNIVMIKIQIKRLPVKNYLFAILRCCLVIAVSIPLVWLIHHSLLGVFGLGSDLGFYGSATVCFLGFFNSATILIPLFMFFVFNKHERKVLLKKVLSITRKYISLRA